MNVLIFYLFLSIMIILHLSVVNLWYLKLKYYIRPLKNEYSNVGLMKIMLNACSAVVILNRCFSHKWTSSEHIFYLLWYKCSFANLVKIFAYINFKAFPFYKCSNCMYFGFFSCWKVLYCFAAFNRFSSRISLNLREKSNLHDAFSM